MAVKTLRLFKTQKEKGNRAQRNSAQVMVAPSPADMAGAYGEKLTTSGFPNGAARTPPRKKRPPNVLAKPKPIPDVEEAQVKVLERNKNVCG